MSEKHHAGGITFVSGSMCTSCATSRALMQVCAWAPEVCPSGRTSKPCSLAPEVCPSSGHSDLVETAPGFPNIQPYPTRVSAGGAYLRGLHQCCVRTQSESPLEGHTSGASTGVASARRASLRWRGIPPRPPPVFRPYAVHRTTMPSLQPFRGKIAHEWLQTSHNVRFFPVNWSCKNTALSLY